MLSGETANGPYFENAVKIMAKTCVEAEGSRNYNALYQSVQSSSLDAYGNLAAGESLASSAVKTAIDIEAKLIVILSESGTTARYVSKFRPPSHVICLTPNATVARQSNGVVQGCRAFIVDSLEDSAALSKTVSAQAIKAGIAEEGDLMVVIAGKTYGQGANDQVRVETITKGDDEMVDDGIPMGHLKRGFQLSRYD